MPIITNQGGYVPEYVINSPFLLIFILPILIFAVFRGFRHHFRLIDYFIIITFAFYIYKLIDYTIMPINIFVGADSIYHHIKLGQQMMSDFSFLHYLQNLNQYIAWYNLIGNLLLLLPLGVYLTIFQSKLSNITLGKIIFVSSSIIELLQLVMNYFYLNNRLFDSSDILLNTLGGILGIIIARLILKSNFLPKSKIIQN